MDTKKYYIEYYQKNKEVESKRRKEYYRNNKEKIKQRRLEKMKNAEYRNKIAEYQQIYYMNHKGEDRRDPLKTLSIENTLIPREVIIKKNVLVTWD